MKNKSNIWENTDGFTEKYICATALFLLSILSHVYNILIDRGGVAPGHGKYIVYGLKANHKMFLSTVMKTVQLPGAATRDS